MKTATITAYPYATQTGLLNIPDDITDPDARKEYIENHWDEIEFGEPDLDYCGTDFDIDIDE